MKTLITSLLSAKTGLVTLIAALATSAAAQAQIKNPDFEFLTADWSQTGSPATFTTPTAIVGLYRTINPVEGTHFGLISNEGAGAKTVSTTFVVSGDPTSQKFLDFEYRFLTDEINQPAFNDTAQVTLTPAGGSPITLVKVAHQDIQGNSTVTLRFGAAYIDAQTIGQSGWQTSATDISAYIGKTVTLSFTVDNGGDTAFLLDSKLAIDNLRITDVPDTLPPVLNVSGDAVVHTHKPTLVLRGTASDKNGITRVEVKVGSAGFKPATGTGSWKFTVKLKSGKNVVRIRSIDGAGNVSKVSLVTIYRD